eukprot:366227-Chlamydomonas_euryale.AAC.13
MACLVGAVHGMLGRGVRWHAWPGAVAKVAPGDAVASAALCRQDDLLMLAGSHGMLLTFSATAAPLLSGTARGNCSMKLPDGASVVSLAVLSENVASSMHSRLSAVSDDSEDVGGSDEAGGHADGDGSTALLLVWASGAAKRISTSELRLNKASTRVLGRGLFSFGLHLGRESIEPYA